MSSSRVIVKFTIKRFLSLELTLVYNHSLSVANLAKVSTRFCNKNCETNKPKSLFIHTAPDAFILKKQLVKVETARNWTEANDFEQHLYYWQWKATLCIPSCIIVCAPPIRRRNSICSCCATASLQA